MKTRRDRVSVLTFANSPCGDREMCWGCGLEPDFIKYGTNPMCRWCEELLCSLLGREPDLVDRFADPGLKGYRP